MADIPVTSLFTFLNGNKEARRQLSIVGTVPPIYISFGNLPKDIEVLTEEFLTPDGKGSMFVDIGSDDIVYGIEFIA